MTNSTRFKGKRFLHCSFLLFSLMFTGFTARAATLTESNARLLTSCKQHQTDINIGSDVPSQKINLIQAEVAADGYESNDSETAAYNLNLAFNNDIALIYIEDASFHSNTDVDYYKLNLPAGYTYKISSELYDKGAEEYFLSNMISGSIDYTVNAKYSYKTENGSWSSTADTKLNDFSYTGGGSVYFKAEPYTSGEYGLYGLKLIIIREASTSTLAVSSNNIPVNATASTTNFTVTSNTKWSVSKQNDSWFSVNPSTGSNNGTVSIATEDNTSLNSRTATIIVSANGILNREITLTQKGVDLAADIYEPNETEATAKELTVTFINNMANIITTGARISTSNDVDYYKILLPTGYSYAFSAFFQTISESSVLSNRKFSYKIGRGESWSYYISNIPDFTFVGGDYIYFKVEPYNPGDKGAYSLNLSINRNAAEVTPTLSVSTSALSLASIDNSTTTFTITSNSGWKVSSSRSWVTVSPATGWGTGTVTVTGMANVGSGLRYTDLTVSCNTVTNKTITISQAGGGSPSPDSYEANETEADAKTLTANFTNDIATIVTAGANIHSSTDVDYYKVQLPAGYTYKVSSKLHNAYYLDNNGYYSLCGKYSVKIGGSWTNYYNSTSSLSDFFIPGGDFIYFKVEPYTSGNKGTYALDLTITRMEGAQTLSVSASNLTINANAGSTVSFDITSNGAWTLTTPTWLTPNIASGTGNATITLTATTSGNKAIRNAYIYVSGKMVAYPPQIYITQSGIDPDADIYEANNTEGAAYATNVAFNNNVGSFMTLGANLNTTTDVDYYKISLAAGYDYIFNLALNQYDFDAKLTYKTGNGGWISNGGSPWTFTAHGGTDVYYKVEPQDDSDKGTYDTELTVNRKTVSLVLSEAVLNLAATASTGSFSMTSNTDWAVTSSQSWLTVGTASGSGSGTITFNATANPDASSRSATIIVTGSGVTKTVIVNQATAAAAALTVSATTLNTAAAANSTASFDITSNVIWTVVSSQPWLTANCAFGINNATIKLTAAANATLTARTATVTVTDSDITRTITVTQDAPVLSVSVNTLNVGAAAGSTVPFNITSNTNWTVACSETWLTAKNSSGSNNATITLTTAANTALTARTADIFITGSGITRTITLTQSAAAPTLSVSDATLSLNAAASSTATFDITSNTSWTAVSSEPWLTVSSVDGSNNATITLTAAANTVPTARTATVTVAIPGITRTITVTQTPIPVLTVSVTTLNVSAAGASTATFEITSNTSWTVVSSQPWLAISSPSGSNSGTILITANANLETSSRRATITIAGSGITKTITLNQATFAEVSLTVSKSALNLATVNGTTAFDITSNIAWTVSSSEPWLTINNMSGINNATITLTASNNTTITARTSTVTVTGSGITKTITVTQAAADPALNVSATTLNMNAAEASTATFDITSNTSWTVASSQAWLTTNSASGSDSTTITLTAGVNPSSSSRSATITVSGSGITRTITITQSGKNTTGVNALSLQDIKFYPNPVINKLTLELDDQSHQHQVLIYSGKGELMTSATFNTNTIEVEMSKYKAGSYFVKIISTDGTKTLKIFKE